MLNTCLVSLIVPVCIRVSIRRRTIFEFLQIVVRETRIQTFSYQRLVKQTSIVVWAKAVNCFSRSLDTYITVVWDTSLSCLTTFCCNQDDTVRCFRTIDGSWSSVFQYRDALNIVRVNRVHCSCFDTVHQDIRVSSIQCTDTTHADCRTILTRTALSWSHLHTRHHTLQTRRNVLDRTAFQSLAIYWRYRTGEVHLLLCTVTYNYDFVQSFSILFHCNTIIGYSRMDFYSLWNITDICNLYFITGYR